MPLTISHAAAVLPLRRTRLPLAALMIGSMSPDYAYFIPDGPGVLSHSFPGVFSFCWPVSLLVWLLFVHLLETPTVALLPERWRGVFPRSDRALTLQNIALASVAVMFGAVTHILWDWCTHSNTPVVEQFPFFETTSIVILDKSFPLFRFLQHLSTVVGLGVLTAWVIRMRRANAARDDALRPAAASHRERVCALLALLGLSGMLAVAGYFEFPELSFGRRLFHFAIGGMTGWALAWIGIAVILQLRLRARS